MAIDRQAWRFFREHGGKITGQGVRSAAAYARDEAAARAAGITFRREPEPDWWPDMLGDHEYWCSDARREAAGYTKGRSRYCYGRRYPITGYYTPSYVRREGHSHEIEVCDAYDMAGTFLTSLGGVIDPSDSYRRVVEAEVAAMALEVLAERDAHARDIISLGVAS